MSYADLIERWNEDGMYGRRGVCPDYRFDEGEIGELITALRKVDEFAELEEKAGDDLIWTEKFRDMIEDCRCALGTVVSKLGG